MNATKTWTVTVILTGGFEMSHGYATEAEALAATRRAASRGLFSYIRVPE